MKVIIFDFDGTLYSNQSDLKNFIDQFTNVFLSQRGIKNIGALEKKFPNILEALNYLSIDRKDYISFVYEKLKYENCLVEDKFIYRQLKRLPFIKIVVSLSPKKHLLEIMKQLNIDLLFQDIISVCDTPEETSKKKIYEIILEKYKLKAKDVLCVGDSFAVDLFPAQQLGMNIFLINQKLRNEKDVKQFKDINAFLKFAASFK